MTAAKPANCGNNDDDNDNKGREDLVSEPVKIDLPRKDLGVSMYIRTYFHARGY